MWSVTKLKYDWKMHKQSEGSRNNTKHVRAADESTFYLYLEDILASIR